MKINIDRHQWVRQLGGGHSIKNSHRNCPHAFPSLHATSDGGDNFIMEKWFIRGDLSIRED